MFKKIMLASFMTLMASSALTASDKLDPILETTSATAVPAPQLDPIIAFERLVIAFESGTLQGFSDTVRTQMAQDIYESQKHLRLPTMADLLRTKSAQEIDLLSLKTINNPILNLSALTILDSEFNFSNMTLSVLERDADFFLELMFPFITQPYRAKEFFIPTTRGPMFIRMNGTTSISFHLTDSTISQDELLAVIALYPSTHKIGSPLLQIEDGIAQLFRVRSMQGLDNGTPTFSRVLFENGLAIRTLSTDAPVEIEEIIIAEEAVATSTSEAENAFIQNQRIRELINLLLSFPQKEVAFVASISNLERAIDVDRALLETLEAELKTASDRLMTATNKKPQADSGSWGSIPKSKIALEREAKEKLKPLQTKKNEAQSKVSAGKAELSKKLELLASRQIELEKMRGHHENLRQEHSAIPVDQIVAVETAMAAEKAEAAKSDAERLAEQEAKNIELKKEALAKQKAETIIRAETQFAELDQKTADMLSNRLIGELGILQMELTLTPESQIIQIGNLRLSLPMNMTLNGMASNIHFNETRTLLIIEINDKLAFIKASPDSVLESIIARCYFGEVSIRREAVVPATEAEEDSKA